jgi:glycerol-3-phosphate dehydrogenase
MIGGVPEIGPDTRAANLERLERETFDVVVVGGGITGAGVALDAAARGLRTALVERGDFASGTSSRSSKMIHGGLRYLAQHELGLTWEASRERDLLRRLAPHLVRPLPFLFPAFRRGAAARLAALGLAIYDVFAAGGGFARHRRATPEDLRRFAPRLDPARVVAAWIYFDAAADDARLVFEVIRTAHRFGAAVVNHAAVEGLDAAGGRLAAAIVRDRTSGRTMAVRGRAFVNAAGVWAHEVSSLDPAAAAPPLRPAKGVHLVLPRAAVPLGAGCVLPSAARDGRSLFVVPFHGETVLAGTTDTEYAGPLDAPAVEPDDAVYVLAALNRAFRLDLGPGDALAAWAGLRPLLAGAGGPETPTADLSRRHHLSVSPSGLVTITGGKLTTYRRMAVDAVDLVCARLGVGARSRTRSIPIGLARPLGGLARETAELAARLGLDPAVASHLVSVHGDRAPAVLALVAEDASLGAPLVAGLPWIAAEAVWAARHEMAVTLADVLERRTRLALVDPEAGLASAAPDLVARALGWPPERTAAEAAAVRARVAAERGPVRSPALPAAGTSGSAGTPGRAAAP